MADNIPILSCPICGQRSAINPDQAEIDVVFQLTEIAHQALRRVAQLEARLAKIEFDKWDYDNAMVPDE